MGWKHWSMTLIKAKLDCSYRVTGLYQLLLWKPGQVKYSPVTQSMSVHLESGEPHQPHSLVALATGGAVEVVEVFLACPLLPNKVALEEAAHQKDWSLESLESLALLEHRMLPCPGPCPCHRDHDQLISLDRRQQPTMQIQAVAIG